MVASENQKTKDLFTLAEVAKLKGVTRQSVWLAVKGKRLQARKIGKYYLVEKAELENWHPRGEN